MKDLSHYKRALEAEKKTLEDELATVSAADPESRGGVHAISDDLDISEADENELGDKFESLDNNEAIENRLEEKLELVVRALAMMEAGKYGRCEICGHEIEEKRLEADPAAPTCIMHMNAHIEEEGDGLDDEEEVA